MIRAVLFDFNGVIIDDEPLHFELFQEVLAKKGVSLSRENYYRDYLGMDDFQCLQTAARDQRIELSPEEIQQLIEEKHHLYLERIKKHPPLLPGAIEFIRSLEKTHYIGIVSGALREEIEIILQQTQISKLISVIVAAGEIPHGKPAPDGYQKALELLNRDFIPSHERLMPKECLVIEDSIWGIESARSADMPCVAITSSYPAEKLPGAISHLKDFTQLQSSNWFSQINQKLFGE